MRKILATTVACIALLAQTSAQAANGCLGCNVADEGVLNPSLVGATIYYDGTRGVAARIDTSDSTVYVTLSDGRQGWAPASDTYTQASYDERTAVKGGLVVFALCALFCGSSSSNSSESSSSSTEARRQTQPQYRYTRPETPAYGSAPSAPPAPNTSGLYGNCHGGAAYGC